MAWATFSRLPRSRSCGGVWGPTRWFGVGTKLENLSVAQIVISTAPHESQTLAFNYASLALNNSFFLHHLKPPTAPARNHESVLLGKPLSHERTHTHTLASVIAAQLGSLADLKTYVAAAAQGTNSGGGAGGFVWLVTDALGRLGVVATYGGHAPRRRAQAVPTRVGWHRARRRLSARYAPAPPCLAVRRTRRRTGARAIHERTRVRLCSPHQCLV
ncbi:hypothetical protein EDB84DRAFT_1521829 [Lactarius hengduanensis]|nr:hypothetical protein EDB84DRAFT_1521829 [Lactarius hengduanensis]